MLLRQRFSLLYSHIARHEDFAHGHINLELFVSTLLDEGLQFYLLLKPDQLTHSLLETDDVSYTTYIYNFLEMHDWHFQSHAVINTLHAPQLYWKLDVFFAFKIAQYHVISFTMVLVIGSFELINYQSEPRKDQLDKFTKRIIHLKTLLKYHCNLVKFIN